MRDLRPWFLVPLLLLGGCGGMASHAKGSGGDAPPNGNGQLPPSGLLTAGAWDDNANFDHFLRYQATSMSTPPPGLPEVPVADRLVVLVKDSGGQAVPGATVVLTSNQKELSRAVTGTDGRVLVFPGWMGVEAKAALTITATSGGVQGAIGARAGDTTATVALAAAKPALAGLDVALIIDTTGSMGDEIEFLQSETLAISDALHTVHPELDQRWASVAYRDEGDAFVTRPTDFTDDLLAYQLTLRGLQAGGGNDYPEAPDRALAAMNELRWRPGAVARVAFWIADAPHHAEREKEMVAAIEAARARGIHLYPIAASGADDLTEFTMRLAALVTGGRYLFITNDSGIGNDHQEPHIPCYQVTSLQKAMLRMLAMELTGTRVDPAPSDVIRTSGNPHDGRCALGDGELVDLL